MVPFQSTSAFPEQEQFQAMGYYRLSKDAGTGHESDSISNQRKLVHAYVETHPGITLVDEAYDDGYSGTNYNRPGFQSVLDAVKEGRVNCVIVKDLSRLGREYIETGKYLEMIFPSLGVRFIAINDDVDSKKVSAGDDLIIPIKNIMNESYCRELSKKLRIQFRVQRGKGEFLGAFASYGYCKSTDDKHRLVIDENAAEIVRDIFSLKLQGYSQKSIADILNDEHVLSPCEYKKSQGLRYNTGYQAGMESKWSAVTINRILTNPIYIGTLIQGKRGTPNYKIKKVQVRNKKDWVVVTNNHPPIIDPLIFDTVQKIIERDTRRSPQEEKVFPLAGMVYCADCNRAMLRRSVSRGKRTFYYYICSGYKNGKECTSHSFEQTKLEQTVLHAIIRQIQMIIEMDQMLNDIGLQRISDIQTKRLDVQIAKKHQSIDRYQAFREKLYEALNENLIDRNEYSKMREKYTALIEAEQKAIQKLEGQRTNILTHNGMNMIWIEQYIRFQDIAELSREAVVTLIDKIYVYEDKHVKIKFNYRNEIAYYAELLQRKELG